MDQEKYTDRSRGFIQAAHGLALRSNHQRLTPEHLLKTLLDDKEGLASNLMRAAGGSPEAAAAAIDRELAKLPKVEGSGAGQVIADNDTLKLLQQAEKLAEQSGDSFVTAERLLLAVAMAGGTRAGRVLPSIIGKPAANLFSAPSVIGFVTVTSYSFSWSKEGWESL